MIRHRAFTLVELLVVIAIIVVLLAMMIPALDKAMYQAEVAVCGTRLKAIATSSTVYAFDQKRYYPSRPANYAWDALFLRHPNTDSKYMTTDGQAGVPFDLRENYRDYGTLSMFADPGSPEIKFGDSDNPKQGGLAGLQGDVHIYSNYFLYVGWAPHQPAVGANQRLSKIGDKWTVTDGWGEPVQTRHRMSVLAADRDDQIGYGFAFSPHGHPTGEQEMSAIKYQAQATKPDDGTSLVVGGKFVATTSYWQGGVTNPNGVKGDYNYAYTDGSVRRESQVKYDDPRMIRAQTTQWNGTAAEPGYVQGRHNKLPKGGQ